MAFLAAAAVVMTVRNDQSRTEKVCWVLVGFSLLFIEVRAIDQDRTANDARQARILMEERQEFANLLSTVGKNFDTILGQSSATLKQTQTTLIQMTGDPETPPYVWLADIRKGRQGALFVAAETTAEFHVFNRSDSYSAYSPIVTVAFDGKNTEVCAVPDIPANQHVPMPCNKPSPDGAGKALISFRTWEEAAGNQHQEFKIEISCRAGNYRQVLYVAEIGPGQYVQAAYVYKATDKKPLFTKIEPKFPRDVLK